MKNFYKNRFAITDNGASNLSRATISSFVVYCVCMLPVFILMFLSDQILNANTKSPAFYTILSSISIIILYIALNIEYTKLYSATYEESANLRIRTSEELSRLPLSYFSKHDLSDIAQTIMSDIEGIEHAMSHSIPKVGGMALFFPLMSIMMLAGNIKMGLAVIIPSLFSFLMVLLSKKFQENGHSKYYSVLRRNSEAFQENIEMQQEIKTLGLNEALRVDLYKKMEESEKIHILSELNSLIALASSSIFSFVSLGVVILVGVKLMISNEISILYLIGYLLAAIKLKDAFDASKEGIIEIFYLTPKIKRLKEINAQQLQEGKETDLNKFDVELQDVYFSYDTNSPVLNGVSFTAKQGEVTALVGESGSGKTSILRLVSRLYDYDKGKIYIDGKDIKNISTDSLFNKTSIVFQDVTLFNSSVLENVRIGRQDASDEEVMEAMRLANCDFVDKLENGYETLIGENGAELSGGERQRLSIARAFLKDAPILILDEIAASLDVDNEKKIQESLNKLIKNKTVIIISHRLKSIEKADKIVVLHDGKVESQGNHTELMKKSPIYQNLIAKTKLAEEFIY